MTKKAYEVRNWANYNKSLVNRGSIDLWFSKNIFLDPKDKKCASGNRGRPEEYSDQLIESALTIRQLFNLTLRATEGFIRSILELMNLKCKTPTYSTLSKRSKLLHIKLGAQKTKSPRHVLVDSTGVQVIGEGEWKTLIHGRSKYQLWRKLHIAIDAKKQDILSGKMTESSRLDGNYLPELINQIDGDIFQITGDGGYDKKNCYQAAYKRNAKPIFPPQHNACVQRNKYKKDPALIARDDCLVSIGQGEGKEERLKEWKKTNNYHRRSLVETAMSRMKFIFGDRIRSRSFENQQTDLLIRCKIINKMNSLGMPLSVIKE